MSKFLISTTEVYRVDSEAEASNLINDSKNCSRYALSKYSTIKKSKKSKGEIVDEWYRVTLVKNFNDEKEPDTDVNIDYSVESVNF